MTHYLLTSQSTSIESLAYLKDLSLNKKYIEPDLLKHRCNMAIDDFRDIGSVTETKDGIFIYKDNGAKILAVAHLDYVENNKRFNIVGNRIYTPQLDDRLGVHMILDVLPKFDLQYDILLTEGEESGQSTAQHFVLPAGKEYNWIFEVDRMGTYSVMYQYETPAYVELLRRYDIKLGLGSFTDICELDHLGVMGINFACGYYNNHSINSYVDTDDLTLVFDKVIPFLKAEYENKYPHDIKLGKYRYSYMSFGSYDHYNSTHVTSNITKSIRPDNTSNEIICGACGRQGSIEDFICLYCGEPYVVYQDTVKQCPVCNNTNCKGFVRCPGCEFFYHNDVFLDNFQLCSSCLEIGYNIDRDILNDFYINAKLGIENPIEIWKWMDGQTAEED
jgi:hypothetical protein